MKNIFYLIFFTLLSISCHSQNSKDYNFGFESKTGNNLLPDGWFSWGNNKVKIESTQSHSGKKSVSLQSDTADRTGGIAYILINSYRGKEITMEGYIKTENVENSAGLFITFEDQQEIQIESKDIKTENLNGTTDWKKYTITVNIPEASNKIMMGGFLKGKEKVLFDQFKLYIDGKNIEELSPQDLSQSPDEFFLDSQFRMNGLNKKQIDNLYQLGKTWGYLKYHSPENSKGNLNWDYELFRFLPNINSKNFDYLLYSWCKSFSTALKTDIKENYYIDWVPNEGNPIFKNEESYLRMKWDDDGMKLLALFRYWNSINYFFPYKDLIGKNWDLVLKDYIPKIVHTDDELSYKLVLLELTKEINDTHAGIYDFGSIIDEFYGINEAPLKTRFIGDQLVITDISKQNTASGFAVGDIITEINHKKVNDLLAEKAKYIPASNKAALLRDISSIILKTNENDIVITLQHNNGKLSDISLQTIPGQDLILEKSIPTHKELDHNIGYIYPAVITKEEIHTVMKKFMNKKGIIIDLRCYPKEFSTSILSDYFFPTSKEFAQFKTTSLQHPGKFEVSGNAKIGKTNRNYYKGKVAILVDETTQSASEFIVMALRTVPQSVVIGSQTAGADGDVSKILLPGGVSTSISGLGVYYPNGKGTQRTGISIDIQVKQNLQSIRNGEDPLIEKAIEFINQ
ncbi:S41 family peptidase [Chryseobacterium viscerum]|uniref:Peptidase S41 n=1 Tax=Chryseobacterium viscerum TaxID=1037377 RepID=A0A316WGE2_9FLAO|nr:S41 family peptidase [Chryseobacterium viscerum]PWN60477.1 peptidase S41 [Chryseobacterium viscerum]